MGAYMNGLEVAMTALQIVIVGQIDNSKTYELANAVLGRSLPCRTMMVVDPRDALPAGHPAAGKTMQNGPAHGLRVPAHELLGANHQSRDAVAGAAIAIAAAGQA